MATGGHPSRSPRDLPGPLTPRPRWVVLDEEDIVVLELDLCPHEQPDGAGLYRRDSQRVPRRLLW